MEDSKLPDLEGLGYRVIKFLGSGAYGKVYQAMNTKKKEIVALKVMFFEGADQEDNCQGLTSTALREFSCLMFTRGKSNIMSIKDLFVFAKEKYMIYVMDYFPLDLSLYMSQKKGEIKDKEIMVIMYQILNGLFELHKMYFMHRDLKPGNIVYNPDTLELRIIDFGLCREPNFPGDHLSNEVASPGYRPIEVLMGSTNYTPAIDVWCAGIIFYELLCGCKPFTPKTKSEVSYIFEILSEYGSPSREEYPSMYSLKHCPQKLPRFKGNRTIYKKVPKSAYPLIEKMLRLNPSERIPPEEALKDPYFRDYPQIREELLQNVGGDRNTVKKLINSRRPN